MRFYSGLPIKYGSPQIKHIKTHQTEVLSLNGIRILPNVLAGGFEAKLPVCHPGQQAISAAPC